MEEVKEDITNDEIVDTEVDVDETTENEPSIETLTVQKKKALEQRDAARRELEELRKKVPQTENKPAQTVDKSGDSELKAELNTIKFTVANKDLDADNVAEIVDYAKGKGISLEEAKKSPVIQAYLKADQEQKSIDGSSPDGVRSPKTKTEKPLSEMSRDEHKAWAMKEFGIK